MGEFKSFEELEQAYKALKQEVGLLEREWRDSGVLEEVEAFECEFLEEQTAKELGVAGVTALGVGTLHKILKLILPSKAATPLIGGAWVLGGAFIIFHFSASTAAGWALMTQRNARRKRMLQRKLEALHHHLESLTDTVGARQPSPPPAEGEIGPEEGEDFSKIESPPVRRSSPSHSTGSSAELVEAPTADEDEAEGGDGSTSAGAGTSAGTTISDTGKKAETGPRSSLDSWRRYASLGGSRKKDS